MDEISQSDPPFIYREPINRSGLNHVVNDVYVRTHAAKKWHRVYRVGYTFAGSDNARLAAYGRSLLLVCGHGGSDAEPDDGWVFHPTPMRTDMPGPNDICKACERSDARYGKGDIPNTARWDR